MNTWKKVLKLFLYTDLYIIICICAKEKNEKYKDVSTIKIVNLWIFFRYNLNKNLFDIRKKCILSRIKINEKPYSEHIAFKYFSQKQL